MVQSMGRGVGLGLRGVAALLVCAAVPFAARASVEARDPGQRASAQQRAQAYLGIGFVDLTDEQVAALHLKGGRGVEVLMVDHDGPAGKAGLQPHDVIVSVNGQMIANSDALRRTIHDAGAGGTIAMVVFRNSKLLNVSALLADREAVQRQALARLEAADPAPAPDPLAAFGEGFVSTPAQPAESHSFLGSMLHSAPFTGFAASEMEPQLAVYFGAPDGEGLLVNTVMPNSPAATCGLRAGDVVLKADEMPLRSLQDWTRYLHASRGKAIVLTVLRAKQRQVVTLQPDVKKHSLLEWPKFF
jgi:serine protease Do